MKRKMNPASLANLKKSEPYRFTSETGRECAKKGGQASGAARKRKKEMAAFAAQIADTTVTKEALKKKLTDIGIEDPEACNNVLVPAAVFREAIRGNMTAVEKWVEDTM